MPRTRHATALCAVTAAIAVLALASCGDDSGKDSSAASNVQGTTGGQGQGTTGGQARGTTGETDRGATDGREQRQTTSRSKQKRRAKTKDEQASNEPAPSKAKQQDSQTTDEPARKQKRKKRKGPLSIKEQRKILLRHKDWLYNQQKGACGGIGAALLARQYGAASLESKDVARAYARAFVKKAPQFPYEPIYEGCLAGLGGK